MAINVLIVLINIQDSNLIFNKYIMCKTLLSKTPWNGLFISINNDSAKVPVIINNEKNDICLFEQSK